MPLILSIAPQPAPHRYSQDEVRVLMQDQLPANTTEGELAAIFANSRVEDRYFILPLPSILKLGSFNERNLIFATEGRRLVTEAARHVIEQSGIDPAAIGCIMVISTTGIATPSLDTYLIQDLGLSPTVQRIPIFGWGCSGGANGLALANQFARANPTAYVLMLNLELCSLTYHRGDTSKKGLIANAIFNDGASATLIAGDECPTRHPAPQIRSVHSRLYPDTSNLMGWKQVPDGLEVILSPDIPSFVADHAATFLDEVLLPHTLTTSDLSAIITHPGGARILDRLSESTTITADQLRFSTATLQRFGNMSSCSLLFALSRAIATPLSHDAYAMTLAFGPGFSAEGAVLQWM